MPGLFAVNRPAQEFISEWCLPDNQGKTVPGMVNGSTLAEAYKLIEEEFKSPGAVSLPQLLPKGGADLPKLIDIVATDIRLLRAKHWLKSRGQGKGANGELVKRARAMRLTWFSEPNDEKSQDTGAKDRRKTLDDINDQWLFLAKVVSPAGILGEDLNDQEQRDYRADLMRYYPLQANPHLIDDGTMVSPFQSKKVLTILYFPETRGAPAAVKPPPSPSPVPAAAPPPTTPPSPAAPVPAPAPSTPTPSRSAYCYSLELRPSGGWFDWNGWELDARFALYDLSDRGRPIVPADQPTIPLLHQGTGWTGFRPTAVVTTEEQVAARYWPELKKLRGGADIVQPLTPKKELEPAYPKFLARLLTDRLGRPLGSVEKRAEAYRTNTFEALAESMDSWVVWPRRFNGGTWWGAIQFTVAVLSAVFVFEFFRLSRLIDGVIQELKRSNSGPLLPPDIEAAVDALAVAGGTSKKVLRGELAHAIDSRTHLARYLVGALPLVGFLGSVAGLSNSLIGSSAVSSPDLTARQAALQAMQIALGTAFDKSMLAFFASIVCLFLLSRLSARIDRLG